VERHRPAFLHRNQRRPVSSPEKHNCSKPLDYRNTNGTPGDHPYTHYRVYSIPVGKRRVIICVVCHLSLKAPHSSEPGWLLTRCGDSSTKPLALLILNVNRDPRLRDARAKTRMPATTPARHELLKKRLHWPRGCMALSQLCGIRSLNPRIRTSLAPLRLSVHVNLKSPRSKENFAKG